MYLFYLIVILFGIACIVFSFIMLLIERKKSVQLTEDVDYKKEELINAINDAEQIVMEMNNFSDYLFERLDNKAKDFETTAFEIESRINQVIEEPLKVVGYNGNETKSKIDAFNPVSTLNPNYLARLYQTGNKNSGKIDLKSDDDNSDFSDIYLSKSTKVSKNANEEKFGEVKVSETPSINNQNSTNDKVIHINPRYREVYALYEKGYTEVDIAKKLKVGMGEIKLILGVGR